MFERPTVFIVGAGASKEIDFPIGSDLTQIIANKLHEGSSTDSTIDFGDPKIAAAIQQHLIATGRRNGDPFYRAGRDIAAGMSQAISIDNYLHAHAEDATINFVGKLGIAASILEAERESRLAVPREADTFDLGQLSTTWYTQFFQMLTEGVQRRNLEQIFDNVSFITFNYDRCIEHYLLHALANYFRTSSADTRSIVNLLRIEHPYGQVGRLPWQQREGNTPFGTRFHGSELPEIASQIRTFTEQVKDGDMIDRAKRLITDAEVVVYLGFSYGNMNMDLLSLQESQSKEIFGTCFGISLPNRKSIEEDIICSMGSVRNCVENVHLADMTCADILKSYWRPILRGGCSF
jgi:hypothetical protein